MSSRRRFVAGAAALAAAGLPWGCARPTPGSPEPAGSATPNGSPDPDLTRFLALSSVLTGFDGLDPTVGSLYLAAIRADAARSKALDALVERSGIASAKPPSSPAELARSGIFTDPATLATTSQILADWFSGTYAGPNGPVTATWSQALAWRACRFTKPPATCGGAMGYWAKAPA